MECRALEIEDVKIIVPRRLDDPRGFFEQMHHRDQYAELGIGKSFVQTNWSRSSFGVLRGLHYQLTHPQAKLVTVIRGSIFDVAVDIRGGSPTFGKWVGAILSDENGRQIYVPEGFAHGFLVLSPTVDLIYQCSELYAPGDEYGLRWNDPKIGIAWPEIDREPLVSGKDRASPCLHEKPHGDFPEYAG